MNKIYSIYVKDTGLFTGRGLSCEAAHLAQNLAPHEDVVEGAYPHNEHRVNLTTLAVEPYAPPAEAPEVLAEKKRSSDHREALLKIQDLEATQPRILREMALGDSGALEKLRDIDTKISALRTNLIRRDAS